MCKVSDCLRGDESKSSLTIFVIMPFAFFLKLLFPVASKNDFNVFKALATLKLILTLDPRNKLTS